MEAIQTAQIVGDIAAAFPAVRRVFDRHGIDYCCGGRRSLEEASRQSGVAVAELIDEIRHELGRGTTSPEALWNEAPLHQVIDHILERYHAPLREEMPRLEAMARKVLEVHGPKDPARFQAIVLTFVALKDDLVQHMEKEEQILFPWIRSGRGESAGPPIRVMHMEHDAAAELLSRLSELTDEYTVPAEACATWRALWEGLAELDDELKRHIHLENNVLFPRALQGA
jgi:regulator of cell morphogenesis and NO signaling